MQYSWVNSNFDHEYSRKYGDDSVNRWREVVGASTFLGLHHYCASIHYLSRSKVASTAQTNEFLVHQALADALYSYTRSDSASPVYIDMSVTMAQIHDANGQADKAIAVLEHAIQVQPGRPEPYGMLARLQRSHGQLKAARETLKAADVATDGKSVDIHYNLGLISLELGDVESAINYAKQAYSRGYPLDGLKRKLMEMGRWKD